MLVIIAAAVLLAAVTIFLRVSAISPKVSRATGAAVEANIALWQAMGEHYQAHALNAERNTAADTSP